jgi:hypothetical protein
MGIRFLQQYIGSPLSNLGGIFQKKGNAQHQQGRTCLIDPACLHTGKSFYLRMDWLPIRHQIKKQCNNICN